MYFLSRIGEGKKDVSNSNLRLQSIFFGKPDDGDCVLFLSKAGNIITFFFPSLLFAHLSLRYMFMRKCRRIVRVSFVAFYAKVSPCRRRRERRIRFAGHVPLPLQARSEIGRIKSTFSEITVGAKYSQRASIGHATIKSGPFGLEMFFWSEEHAWMTRPKRWRINCVIRFREDPGDDSPLKRVKFSMFVITKLKVHRYHYETNVGT